MPNIVISYRREDTKWIVGRIFDRLETHYGRDNVWMDIDGVPLGADFREHIRKALQGTDVLLAVIGPQWFAVHHETGQPRIADDTDWVRIELEVALAKNIPVIPVLIDRARLPKPIDLPETVRDFAYRQAADLDTGLDFRSHMDRLIRAIDQAIGRLTSKIASIGDFGMTQGIPRDFGEEVMRARASGCPSWLRLLHQGQGRSSLNTPNQHAMGQTGEGYDLSQGVL